MKKEIAKFLCGLTAWEAVSHFSLWANGVLPITLFGFTINETINTIQIIVFVIVSCLLGYYGWKKNK
jgi:hypothetical protein